MASLSSSSVWRNWLQKSKTGQLPPPAAALFSSFLNFSSFLSISQDRSLSGEVGRVIPLTSARRAMKAGERDPSRWRWSSTCNIQYQFLINGNSWKVTLGHRLALATSAGENMVRSDSNEETIRRLESKGQTDRHCHCRGYLFLYQY